MIKVVVFKLLVLITATFHVFSQLFREDTKIGTALLLTSDESAEESQTRSEPGTPV